ncbi:hypothetical protein RF11_10281 [Thelohanellus kitauei]|uniref:Uncharacterized protein n=1 Tax=Thelohanellus kitauei TaxID=669202 RepID=A0A0C2IQ95_THEKT|nr:hypothetical protein RF11_10281 [Thelohanellus kitauei]
MSPIADSDYQGFGFRGRFKIGVTHLILLFTLSLVSIYVMSDSIYHSASTEVLFLCLAASWACSVLNSSLIVTKSYGELPASIRRTYVIISVYFICAILTTVSAIAVCHDFHNLDRNMKIGSILGIVVGILLFIKFGEYMIYFRHTV